MCVFTEEVRATVLEPKSRREEGREEGGEMPPVSPPCPSDPGGPALDQRGVTEAKSVKGTPAGKLREEEKKKGA